MPEVTLNTEDPADVARMASAVDQLRAAQHGAGLMPSAQVARCLLAALELPAELPPGYSDSDYPPGLYGDQDGDAWRKYNGGEWGCTGAPIGVYTWDELNALVALPLVPLWTADELIPDPDDEAALNEFLDFTALGRNANRATVQIVLASLRARGESRVPTGGTDDLR